MSFYNVDAVTRFPPSAADQRPRSDTSRSAGRARCTPHWCVSRSSRTAI